MPQQTIMVNILVFKMESWNIEGLNINLTKNTYGHVHFLVKTNVWRKENKVG